MNTYIKDVLTSKGLTQQDLADKMHVTRQTVSATISRPSFPTLERIAAALGVAPWQLLAPPEVVEAVERAKEREGDGCALLAVVRMGRKTYTANTLDELREIVRMIAGQEKDKPGTAGEKGNNK